MPENERDKVLKSIRLEQLTPNTTTVQDKFEQMIKQVYSQEYATEFEEIDMGINCIAVPIFNSYGELKATLSIAAPAITVDLNFKNLLIDLKRARNCIENNGLERR